MDGNNEYFDNLSGTMPQGNGAASQGNGVMPQGSSAMQGGAPQSPASQPTWASEQAKKNAKAEKGSGKGLFIGGMITGIACALLVFGIVYLSNSVQNAVESGKLSEQQGLALDESSAVNSATLTKMQRLARTIDQHFYLHDVTNEEIQDGIYRGMLNALDDPYSEYYSPEELADLMEQTEGVYYGIGAYISLDTDTSLPKISGTIAGAPSEEVDLRANDLIYEVDGVSTYGMTLTEVVSLIKGPENTNVILTILREGAADYLEVTVERRQVETPTVEYSMEEDGMAYIQLTEFDEISITQFETALATARSDGMKGLILDLRANPGGSLNAVVEMARMILPKGMIVYTENKYKERSEYTCDGKNELDVPLVVLIDMNSASAAEIMAGAIKDYELGTLVGTTTFGKGIVQQIIPLGDGSAAKITISAYYTPKGNNIHGIGIEPDVVCEFDGEAYYGSDDRPDNQLEKAKEVLREKMK